MSAPQFSRGGGAGQTAYVRSRSCEPCQSHRHGDCWQAKAEFKLTDSGFECACYDEAQNQGDHDKHFGADWDDDDF